MRILLVDGTNNFLRNYAVKPDLSLQGESIGGVVGFLQSLGFFIRINNPDKVIVVWDGPGGSKKRRSISERYKAGRKPTRLNRNYDFELLNPQKNKVFQRVRLAEYLNDLPVSQLSIQDVEADDIIAYLSHYFADDEKIIASNDKDFFQLVSDKVKVFRPTKKALVDVQHVIEEYNIHPKNFALARAVVGDPSDNLKGVPGIGYARLIKYFPLITEDGKVSLQNFFSFFRDSQDKKYRRILENEKVVIENHQLMQLENPIISAASTQKAIEGLSKKLRFNATAFRIRLLEDGVTCIGDNFFQLFKFLHIKGKEHGI